jgi:hypothetical protein
VKSPRVPSLTSWSKARTFTASPASL